MGGGVGGGEREARTTAIGRGRHGATNLRWYNIKPWPRGVGASVGFGAPGLHLVVLHGRCGHPTPFLFPPHPPFLIHTTFSSLFSFGYSSRWVVRKGERQWCPSPPTNHHTPPPHSQHLLLAAALSGLASGSVAVLMVVELAALVLQCRFLFSLQHKVFVDSFFFQTLTFI